MAKALAKRNLIFFAIVAGILAILCFVNFAIPTTSYRYVGFANSIVKDLDVSGTVSSTYEIKLSNTEVNKELEIAETVAMLNTKLDEFGYGNSRVSVSGTELFVELPNIINASSVLSAISVEGELSIRGSTTASDDDLTGDEVSNISSAFSQLDYGVYKWGVNIDFTNAGQTKLNTITEGGSGTLYIYVGEEQISAISYSSQINQNYMFFYGDYNSNDTTNLIVLQLLMGKYEVDFDMVSNQIVESAPVISNNIGTWLYILIAVVCALFGVAMFSLFGEFGWIINLAFVFFAVLVMFFLQAVPIFILSLGGIVGILLGILLLYFSNLFIFNNIKKGYAEGKKIPLATKLGFRNATMTVVDLNVIAVIASIVIYFVGGVYAKSFALALGICSALALFTSLLLTKWFAKWYLAINSKDAEKLHLKREAHIDEIN